MSAPDKKLESTAEAPKVPEVEGILSLLKKTVNWVRDRIAKIPGFSWLKRKLNFPKPAAETVKAVAEHPKPAAHDTGQETHKAPEAHKPAEVKEEKEKVDKMALKVGGECNSDGPYVGLTVDQMKNLDVTKGCHVELEDHNGKSLGVFTVGKIIQTVYDAADKADQPTICTANVPEGVENIVVKKTDKKPEKTTDNVHKLKPKDKKKQKADAPPAAAVA